MPLLNPIVLIDDDAEDLEFLQDGLNELSVQNELIWIQESDTVLEFLLSTPKQPFLILCDINLPKINGLELKRQIDENKILKQKSIPFIFYSTHVDQHMMKQVYANLSVQGFFKKEADPYQNVATIKCIVDYWSKCVHPNSPGSISPYIL